MSRSRRRNHSGFSFLEILMAVFLVACCGSLVLSTMPAATMSRGKASYMNRAVNAAQREMEAVKSLGYANITPAQLLANQLIDSTTEVADDTYSFTAVDAARQDEVSRNLPSGTARITIEQPDIDLKRVTIRITWVERGVNREYRLGSVVANL